MTVTLIIDTSSTMNYKNDLFDLSARIGAHRSKVSQTHVKMLLEVGPNHGPKALRKLEANDPEPTWVSSDEFVGRISVLVKDGTSTKYFGSRSRLFCFQVEGRFRREWSGDDIEFGIWLHEPIARLPFGSSIAISFVKVPIRLRRRRSTLSNRKHTQMIDPGLNVDLKSTTPHALSPLLCSMNVLRQDPSHPEILWDAPMPQEGESDRFEKAFDFPPWIHGQDAKEYTELGQDSYTSSEQRKVSFLTTIPPNFCSFGALNACRKPS